jgi:dihydroxy-acid dehydratase
MMLNTILHRRSVRQYTDEPIPENKMELKVSDEVLAERKAKWIPREPKVTTGYLARYASMVTSGNRGAILEIPR